MQSRKKRAAYLKDKTALNELQKCSGHGNRERTCEKTEGRCR